MSDNVKVYFASDFHLGIDGSSSSRERELALCDWLDEIRIDADAIYLVGDLFDFWFEYKRSVPRGFVRFIGKLAELSDLGIPLYLFTGNHDMWMFDYLEEELDLEILREPVIHEYAEKRFYIGHGDGLGPGDRGYKFIKKVFANPICQWLFARLHPNFGIWLADFWSGRSRQSNPAMASYLGDDKEWLVQYCMEHSPKLNVDYFIFGHRHLPIDMQVPGTDKRYINLGDWIEYNTYAVFDGEKLEMKAFRKELKTWP